MIDGYLLALDLLATLFRLALPRFETWDILRYVIGTIAPNPTVFPWTTLAINVAASFLIAFFAGQVIKGVISNERLALLLQTGFCGGFSTLSAVSMEVMGLTANGHAVTAATYTALTFTLCIFAAFMGTMLSRG